MSTFTHPPGSGVPAGSRPGSTPGATAVEEVIGKDNRYLLRLWCDGAGGDEWRASLRELNGQESWKFASIADLVRFLGSLDSEGGSSAVTGDASTNFTLGSEDPLD